MSGDGSRVLSAGMDRTLRLWDPSSRQLLSTLAGHEDSVTSASFTPDGLRAVSGSWDRTARVWDLATGRVLHVLGGHGDYVSGVAVSPRLDLCATASCDQLVRLWDLATGRPLRELKGHESNVSAVAWSPEGRFVASAGWDGTVRAWDPDSGACACLLEGHEGNVNAVAVDVRVVRHSLRLDEPLYLQYFHLVGRAAVGDFGVSFRTRRPVMEEIGSRYLNTLLLGTASILVAIFLGGSRESSPLSENIPSSTT